MSSNRKSSHYSDDEQFSIRGTCLVENLFGTRMRDDNNKKYTWFQLERHPAGGKGMIGAMTNIILHLADWVTYRLTGENVGPHGTSKYKEDNPCYLEEYLGKAPEALKRSEKSSNFWCKMFFHPEMSSKLKTVRTATDLKNIDPSTTTSKEDVTSHSKSGKTRK